MFIVEPDKESCSDEIVFSTIQWLAFILAGSLVAPLAVGNALHLPPADIAMFMQRTFLLIGVSALLQTLFGHKLPMMEGPAACGGVFSLCTRA